MGQGDLSVGPAAGSGDVRRPAPGAWMNFGQFKAPIRIWPSNASLPWEGACFEFERAWAAQPVDGEVLGTPSSNSNPNPHFVFEEISHNDACFLCSPRSARVARRAGVSFVILIWCVCVCVCVCVSPRNATQFYLSPEDRCASGTMSQIKKCHHGGSKDRRIPAVRGILLREQRWPCSPARACTRSGDRERNR